MSESTESIFFSNYAKFAAELLEVVPEYTEQIRAALVLPDQEKKGRFRAEVCKLPSASAAPPTMLLPGVPMTEEIWGSLSENSRSAIQQYITILSFSLLFDDGVPGSAGTAAGGEGMEGFTAEWAEEAMKQMREKLGSVDFSTFAEKLKGFFGGAAAGGAGGAPTMPQIPERFLKGQIARLAEDIMQEFRPEEFGIRPEELEASNADPMRAFQMLSEIYTRNPQILQTVMKRIAKKMQQKIQRGELRPSELAAEAEELMKHFTENAQFRDLMEMFKTTFGMEDPDLARAAGNEGSARLAMVRDRLRKKLAAKQGPGGGGGGGKPRR
jgi:hypothetical protein